MEKVQFFGICFTMKELIGYLCEKAETCLRQM